METNGADADGGRSGCCCGDSRAHGSEGSLGIRNADWLPVVGATPIAAHCLDWVFDPPFEDPERAGTVHIRLRPGAGSNDGKAATAILEFVDGTGSALAVFPGFICTVVVDHHRIEAFNKCPRNSRRCITTIPCAPRNSTGCERPSRWRLDMDVLSSNREMRRHSRVASARAKAWIQPWAYMPRNVYAAAGRYNDVESVLGYLLSDPPFAAPFDVAMLATRNQKEHSPVTQGHQLSPARRCWARVGRFSSRVTGFGVLDIGS